jgi:hypothetical protein
MHPQIGRDVRDRPLALKRQRTPRSISSCGYVFGRAIAGGSPLAKTDHPGFKASRETRPGSIRRSRRGEDKAAEAARRTRRSCVASTQHASDVGDDLIAFLIE